MVFSTILSVSQGPIFVEFITVIFSNFAKKIPN